MNHPTVSQLRPIDLFDGLTDAELQSWAQAAQLRRLTPGTPVAEQGRPAASLHLVLEGSLEAFSVDEQGRAEPVGEHAAPTWVGAVVALTQGVSTLRTIAITDVTLATIPSEQFVELAIAHRPVFDRVIAQVRPVVQRVTAIEANRERLASLGTMAAGLAHELNNPAAAAQRAAADLADALDVLSSTIGHFVDSGVERAEAQQLVELQRQALSTCAARTSLDALDAADAEEELETALREHGVEEGWKLSEPLSGAGADAAWVARVAQLAGPATPAAVRWVASSLTAQKLAAELAESTQRMSALVGAVKAYAYMDRGALVETDIHEGLETTLTVLGHKLKHTQIEVARDYDRSLPKVTVNGGELNQVWTNLLDNAIQALGDSGTITITTALDGPCVRVDIADDGPGIAPADRERIFDPFFTTKDVGQGTGLGLDTARRIVVERHHGSIDVDSGPPGTAFHVWLPIERPPATTIAHASDAATDAPREPGQA
jgi:signal transduction histidine kinase